MDGKVIMNRLESKIIVVTAGYGDIGRITATRKSLGIPTIKPADVTEQFAIRAVSLDSMLSRVTCVNDSVRVNSKIEQAIGDIESLHPIRIPNVVEKRTFSHFFAFFNEAYLCPR